jgi:hypothetical protein
MLFFQITKRWKRRKSASRRWRSAGRGRALPPESEEEGEKPVYRLDDLKLQEGISNPHGYDPLDRNGGTHDERPGPDAQACLAGL